MDSAQTATALSALSLGLAAFLLGSIPFGLIVGRLFFHSDIRASGSGNIGAANALRSYGKGGGGAVLALDALKGALAALLCGLVAQSATWEAFGAFAAVLGHCYSPWLRFKGGKGVATWLGALAVIAWPLALAFIALWLVVVAPTRWASLGSLSATVLSAAGLWVESGDASLGLWATAAAAVIVWKHRENIGRLAAGRENKISFGKASRA
jgi:glycerol-3-phosphate acyltransferase PlsY